MMFDRERREKWSRWAVSTMLFVSLVLIAVNVWNFQETNRMLAVLREMRSCL
jgi:hypothetical protein